MMVGNVIIQTVSHNQMWWYMNIKFIKTIWKRCHFYPGGEIWIWSLGWSRPAAAFSPWCHLVEAHRAVSRSRSFVHFSSLKKMGFFWTPEKDELREDWSDFFGINMKNTSLLLGAFKHEFYFPFHMGCHPSRRSPSFFKMVKQHQQAVIINHH